MNKKIKKRKIKSENNVQQLKKIKRILIQKKKKKANVIQKVSSSVNNKQNDNEELT